MADPNLKAQIENLLKEKFSGPLDQIRVRDGFFQNVHVWVASPTFRDTPDYMRQNQVWDILSSTLTPQELVLISLILTFDIDEPAYSWALREEEAAAK